MLLNSKKITMSTRLTRDFFARDTNIVSTELLGKVINFFGEQAVIIETESYIGTDDPACHAARGLTKRTEVMFGAPGYSYVYLIYGMYHCLNFVTEREGYPAATLIRGVKLLTPRDKLFEPSVNKVLDGPGKLCRHLGINLSHNKLDIIDNDSFFVSDIGLTLPFDISPRIGIKQGLDKLWRYFVPLNKLGDL